MGVIRGHLQASHDFWGGKIGNGTLCGFHTYVGADDMWVSGSFRPTSTSFRSFIARYLPSSRHRQHTYSSPFLWLNRYTYPGLVLLL